MQVDSICGPDGVGIVRCGCCTWVLHGTPRLLDPLLVSGPGVTLWVTLRFLVSVETTWTERELPVLQAIVAAFDDPDRHAIRLDELVRLCGLPKRDVQLALRDLSQASPPFIEASAKSWGTTYPVLITGATERARRAVGQWPSPGNMLSQLVEGLNIAAEQEDDQAQKKRLREVAAILGGTAKGVATEIIAKLILHAGGMG